MARVLLLSPRAPITLELARLFHAAGHEVVVADSLRLHLCRLSTAVRGSFALPPPALEPDAFVEALAELIHREAVDHVVPTCEEIFWVARGLGRLSGAASVLCDAYPKLLTLHDKARLIELLEELAATDTNVGFRVPETHRLTSLDDVARVVEDPAGWVLKPVFSRFAARTLIRPSPRRLRRASPSVTEPWVAQRYIEGRQLSTSSVAHEGRLSLHATYGAPWRAGQGASVYFVAEQHLAAQAFVEAVVARLGFTGSIAFDFIEDEDGCLWPIECNPRATSGLHLFDRDGRAAAALLGPTDEVVTPVEGRRAMLLGALALYAPLAVRRPADLGRLVRDVWSARDVLLSWSDPAAALMQLLTSATLAARGVRYGIGALAASTVDIEHNGPAPGELPAAATGEVRDAA